jgi:quinol monooxygenase YgiN
MEKLALLARIVAKPGKEEEVAALLAGAVALAESERATVRWYAFRLSQREFGVFDTFADDTGRQAHLRGAIADALITRGPELLAEPLEIDPLDLLAAKRA